MVGNATIRQASRSLTSGVGGGIFEVNSQIDFDIRFLKPDGVEEVHCIYIRALISPDIQTDLIIGLPTIKKYNLLNLLQSHLDTIEHMCEVCADSDTPTQTLSTTQSILINHIDIIADPAQLTNFSESDLRRLCEDRTYPKFSKQRKTKRHSRKQISPISFLKRPKGI